MVMELPAKGSSEVDWLEEDPGFWGAVEGLQAVNMAQAVAVATTAAANRRQE
jgi:hypothetical protein